MRVLGCGFAFSARAINAATEGLRSSGAEVVGWVLHNNHLGQLAPVISDRGILPIPELPGTEPTGLRSPLHWPDLDGQAAEDLRYLADREARFDHEWERSLFIYRTAAHVSEALRDTMPDLLVFGDIPHSLASYMFYLLAHSNGIPTGVVRYGPTPFQFSYVDNIDRVLAAFVGSRSVGRAPTESSERYLTLLASSYAEAMPTYMRDRIGFWTNARRVLRRMRPREFRRPGRIFRAAADRGALRVTYGRLAMNRGQLDLLSRPIVSVFLHLQPERTTVPEGRRFAQQWLVVQALASQVPSDWAVIVREHPSTFRSGARMVRTKNFYEALCSFPNVRLAPLGMSPFDLASRSEWVATTTGTIGFETVARGGRSLVFGNASFLGCPGVEFAQPVERLAQLLDHTHAAVDPSDVLDFLARFDNSERCWVAPWRDNVSPQELRASGAPFAALLPRMVEDEVFGSAPEAPVA